MSEDPRLHLRNVQDERTFLTFLSALAADRAGEVLDDDARPPPSWGPGLNGWEHSTIEAFLEAAVAWVADSTAAGSHDVATNPWRRCADILYAGKIYE